MIPLNTEQQAAIRFDDSTWVSAGAGSGKTRTLVELYIKLLCDHAEGRQPTPERLVAITFTEKAAAEMKDRIREAIDAQAQKATEVLEVERWTQLRRELARAPISTIHSFCSAILRDNPASARVDPAFEVLPERDARRLLDGALETVILGGVQAQDPEVTSLVDLYGLMGSPFGGTGLVPAVASLYAQMAQAGLTVDDCRQKIPSQDLLLAPQVEQLLESVGGIVRLAVDGTTKARSEVEAFLPRWSKLKEALPGIDARQPRRSLKILGDVRRAFKGKKSLVSGKLAKPHWDAAREALDGLESALSEALSIPVIGQVLALVEKVEQVYIAAKNRVSGLDFEDLQVKARNLLRDFSSLRQRYQEAYDILMVDEYQDTNALQDSLVELLCQAPGDGTRSTEGSPPSLQGGPGSDQLSPRKLFMVGDPKQSIYGFRGADVSVFMRWRERLPNVCHLQSNYRSVPTIVSFVNRLFAEVVLAGTSSETWEIRFEKDDAMLAERAGAGTVQLLSVSRGADDLTDAARSREAALLADHIWQAVKGECPARLHEGTDAVRPARFGDCAMLFRVTTQMKLYEHELRRRNIPYYVVKGQGFFECQEIKDVVNVLIWLDDPRQQIALAGFLRSPMVGLSDEGLLQLSAAGYFRNGTLPQLADAQEQAAMARARAWLAEWVELRDRLSPSELVERIVRSTGYLAAIVPLFQGAQKVANVRKLVDLSREYEEKGPYNFRAFVRYLTTLIEEHAREPEYPVWAEKADVVRLMTVHQSKGLQFGLVYVPQMARDNRPPADPLMFHAERGVVAKVRADRYSEWVKPPTFTVVEAERRSRELEESRRLFYVAVTRAADHLIMSGEFGAREARENTWAGWVRAHVGGAVLDTGEAEQAQGVLVWHRKHVAVAPMEQLEPSTEGQDLTVDGAGQRVSSFSPPPPQTLVLTAREVAEYAVCARRHYYLSVLSLEEAPPRARVPAVGALRAESRGNLVHRVLEEISFEADEDAVRAHLLRLVGGEAEELAALGKDILAFLQGPTGFELRHARQVAREVPLYLTLQDVDGWTLQVSGVADLIYQDADGDWHVLDYKQTRLGKGKLPLYRYQLSVYALALMQSFELPQVRIGLRFLEDRSPPPKDHVVTTVEAMRLQQTILKLGRQLGLSSRLLAEDAWPRVEQEQRCHDLECGFRWRCGRMPVPKQQLELALDF